MRWPASISLILFWAHVAVAQTPFFKTHPLGESYRQDRAEVVYEDHNSTLWFGTTAGLFRFDGIEFQPFVKTDSTSNYVRAIHRDRQGRLWVGYDDGSIAHLERQQLRPWRPEEGTPAAPVIGFAEDGQGQIWIATYGEGTYVFDERHLYNFNTDDGLLGNDIYAMAAGADGRIWLGTDGGVSRCRFAAGEKNVDNLTRADGLPDEIVRALLPDPEGNMWLGTHDGGVCFFDRKENTITQPLPDTALGVVDCLELFEGIELWIGTASDGAWRYNLQEGHLHQVPDLQRARVFDLLRDIEGNIWAMTNTLGICSANRQFEFINTSFENVQAVLRGQHDRLWVGTSQGLFTHVLDAVGNSHFEQHLPNLPLNILSLFEDPHRNIWVGTYGQGLYVYQPATGAVRHFSEADGLTNGNILSIDGAGGQFWLATLGGAFEVSPPANIFAGADLAFRNFDEASGLSTNFIYKVFIDSKGRTWFGTDGEGISVLENGAVRNYPVAVHRHAGQATTGEDTRLQRVYAITEDHQGNIWLSTDKVGIFEFDGQKFEHLTVKEGIRNLEITGLATDGKGQIIIVHPTGVDVLQPDTRHLIYYDQEVGIENIDPTPNAVCTDRFGNVWIGARNTIVKYTALREDLEIHPRTLLNSVSVFLEPIDFQNINEFGHAQNNLAFNYLGLWYTDPHIVKYRYQLVGYDLDWITSKDRQATYSNLPPGRYTFRVTSTENDAWSDEPVVEYQFTILTPLWQRWWFVVLCALAAGGLFFWYQKNRDHRLQRESLMKKELVENQLAVLKAQINPHFLFNSFNTLITVIEEDPQLAVEYVENLSDFYRKIMQLRDKEVISLAEEVELVKNYSFLLQKRYGDNFRMNINLNGETSFIVPLTLQILVENAVKHNIISKSKPLTVDIRLENGEYLTVSNNLQPKLRGEQSTRFGLHSLIQRYELLGNKKVKVEETREVFKISIPIIKQDTKIL